MQGSGAFIGDLCTNENNDLESMALPTDINTISHIIQKDRSVTE